MARILYVGTAGTSDPTTASIPFVAANGALEAGHQPEVALLGEASYLMLNNIAEHVHGVGLAPLQELLAKLTAARVPIHV